MREILLITIFSILTISLFAQDDACIPDPIYADTTFGVFPGPYLEETMTGGIPDTACINEPFEFILTAVVPDTVAVMGFVVTLNSVFIDTIGAVAGLPEGITYACNPPNCIFDANTQGCIILQGTPTDANMPGDFPLTLNLTIDTGLLGPVPTTYPGDLFPGSYSLAVAAEGSDNCTVVSTNNVLRENLNFKNAPNPFADFTQIQITSGIDQEVYFEVFNILGEQLLSQKVNLHEGENTIDVDGSDLANGMYIYSLRKGADIISKRMIVQ